MKKGKLVLTVAALAALSAVAGAQQQPAQPGQPAQPQEPMRFFVTSTVPGHGNLGGLEGADAICQGLAEAAGSTFTWHAYLSTQGDGAVNARDRIGAGPWHNFNGVRIAANVDDLHGDIERDRNYIIKETAVDETGAVVNGRGDDPNLHDIFTGSTSHGMAFAAGEEDRTCSNWTSNAAENSHAMVGHHDRQGGNTTSWNSAHPTRGCDAEQIAATGGGGKLYCFAID